MKLSAETTSCLNCDIIYIPTESRGADFCCPACEDAFWNGFNITLNHLQAEAIAFLTQ